MARSIRARLLLVPNCCDQLLPPTESGVLEVAMHAPDAKIVTIATETRDRLQRVVDGRPCFSGPRYPRHWPRPDRCPG